MRPHLVRRCAHLGDDAAEIVGGHIFGSMAVVADGWHMSTHAGALGIAALAYRFASRHARDERFTFGTGKVGELAAFTSAVILAMIAVAIGYEAATRLFARCRSTSPKQPGWRGWASASISPAPGCCPITGSITRMRIPTMRTHAHHAQSHDSNIRAAYVHVLADAVTSVLAIVGLLAGRLYGLVWMDALMALIGVGVILSWSLGLVRTAGTALLDMVPDRGLAGTIRKRLEIDGDKVSDLHLWRLGPGHAGLIAAIVADDPQRPAVYKQRLDGIEGLSHVTIEVHACQDRAIAA